MNNLVKQARDEAKFWTTLYRDHLLWKMADEIERLEGELTKRNKTITEIRWAARPWRLPPWGVQRMVNEALERYDQGGEA